MNLNSHPTSRLSVHDVQVDLCGGLPLLEEAMSALGRSSAIPRRGRSTEREKVFQEAVEREVHVMSRRGWRFGFANRILASTAPGKKSQS